MLGIALSVGNVQAQGILGKLKTVTDKVTKNKGNKSVSGEETSSSGSLTLSGEGHSKPKGQKSNLYELMRAENRPNMVNSINSKFANFKKTASTKVVTLDGLDYLKLGHFFDNRAIVKTQKNGVYCFDEKGNAVKHWDKNDNNTRIVPNLGVYPKFGNNRLIDLKKGSTSWEGTAIIYDQNFNVIKQIANASFVSDYEDGVAIVVTNKRLSTLVWEVTNHYVDANGNYLFANLSKLVDANKTQFRAEQIRPTCEGLAAFCVPNTGYKPTTWGFRDAKGNIIAPAQFKKVQDFSNGLAAVCTDGKWGFIDTKGNMAIPERYSNEPSKFDNCGMAMVMNREGKYMFIDKTGNVVSKEFKQVTPFCNGRALCVMDNGTPDSHYDDYTVMIDSKFNIVSIISDDILVFPNKTSCMQFYGQSTMNTDNEILSRMIEGPERIGNLFIYDGHFYLYIEGCGYCLLSDTGDIVIAGLAGPFRNGIAQVYDKAFHPQNIGYVNTKGEWVIKFELSEF